VGAGAVDEGGFDVAGAIELRDRVQGDGVEPAFFEVAVTELTNAAPQRVVDVVEVHAGLADLLEAPEAVVGVVAGDTAVALALKLAA